MRLDIPIQYSSFFLLERLPNGDIDPPYGADGPGELGLMRVDPGAVTFRTCTEHGTASIELVVSPEHVPPDNSYEDIAELSIVFTEGSLCLLSLDGWSFDLPSPLAPGPYRVRYHNSGLDRMPGFPDFLPERYLIQLWPAPQDRPHVLKVTSRKGAARVARQA